MTDDATSFRNCETHFRQLQPARGDGLEAKWDDSSRQWILCGGSGTRVRQKFKSIAANVAQLAGCPPSADPDNWWLDMLWRHMHSRQPTKNGSVIQRVCETSADYCDAAATGSICTPGDGIVKSLSEIGLSPEEWIRYVRDNFPIPPNSVKIDPASYSKAKDCAIRFFKHGDPEFCAICRSGN